MAEAAGEDASALAAILTSALEARGDLGKIRAQLRASVFSAIHEQAPADTNPSAVLRRDNAGQLASQVCASSQRACAHARSRSPPPAFASQLVLELLQTCQLDYSLSVLAPEAGIKSEAVDRAGLASSLGLKSSGADEPILLQLVRAAMVPGGVPARQPAASSSSVAAAKAPSSSEAKAAAPSASTGAARSSKPSSSGGGCSSAAASSAAAGLRVTASGPTSPSPPSPASPLLSVLPPLGKPKSDVPSYLSDLPPLSGRGATVPPLGGGGGGGGGGAAGGGEAIDERRLDALENKLSSLAGLPLRPAASGSGAAPLAPLGARGAGSTPLGAGGVSSGGESDAAQELEVIEDEIMEEDFEEDDEADASLSLDAGSGLSSGTPGGGVGPPLHGGMSPSGVSPGGHVVPPPRSRQRLSPLETSAQSMDEALSPGRYSREMAGFDLAESIEMPKRG